MSFDNIPHELKLLVQWCCWKYETPKPELPHILTKVPYNPKSHRRVSVIDPQTWCSFNEAVAAMRDDQYAGIGFVFSNRDPYCGIDLDNPLALKDDGSPKYTPAEQADIIQQQEFIFQKFDSYAEYSPSGKGLHIIIKANVPDGKRQDAVEIYSYARFFTMTGNVYRNAPINDHNDMANRLWQSMVKNNEDVTNGFIGSLNPTHDDQVIYDMACRAENGQKFLDLWEGRWQQYYNSQSEADLAIIDIISYYSKNVMQIDRMFKTSALGKRAKAHRQNYTGPMIQRSFDNQIPALDISAILDSFVPPVSSGVTGSGHTPQSVLTETAGRETHTAAGTVDARPAANSLNIDLDMWRNTRPPGILNEIIDYSLAASPRPVYEMSLVASIGLLAGIVGRQYNTTSGSGLNLYIMYIADTGTGKEAIASTITKLVTAIDPDVHPAAARVVGPGDIASGQGLLKFFSRDKSRMSFVSVVGEFGIKLKQITDHRAVASDRTLLRVLLDLFNKSGAGSAIQPTVYSDKEKDTKLLYSPAMTMIGESVGKTFYEALDDSAVASGLLPRFLIIEYTGPRVPMNGHIINPPENLVMGLSALILEMDKLADKGIVYTISETDGANELLSRIDTYCDDMINSNENDAIKQIWNRVHLKVLRIAGLLAVSLNHNYPQIDETMVRWAASLVMTDAYRLGEKFNRGEMGMEDIVAKQLDAVKRTLKDYYYNDMRHIVGVQPELWQEHYITRSFLQQRCRGQSVFKRSTNSKRAFDDAVNDAISNGWIMRTVANDTAKLSSYGGTIFKIVGGLWLNED